MMRLLEYLGLDVGANSSQSAGEDAVFKFMVINHDEQLN